MTDLVNFDLVNDLITKLNTEGEKIRQQTSDARDALRNALELDGLTDSMSDAWAEIEQAMLLLANAKQGIDDFSYSNPKADNLSVALEQLDIAVETLTCVV